MSYMLAKDGRCQLAPAQLQGFAQHSVRLPDQRLHDPPKGEPDLASSSACCAARLRCFGPRPAAYPTYIWHFALQLVNAQNRKKKVYAADKPVFTHSWPSACSAPASLEACAAEASSRNRS